MAKNRGGFYAMPRELWLEELFQRKPHYFMAYEWIVCNASYKDETIPYQGKRYLLKKGQLAQTYRDLSNALEPFGFTKSKIETLLKSLAVYGLIQTENRKGITVITVWKYADFHWLNDKNKTGNQRVIRELPTEPEKPSIYKQSTPQKENTSTHKEEKRSVDKLGDPVQLAQPLASIIANLKSATL